MYPGREVTAQSIRGSVIANLLAQGHDISVVQRFAGHKYPSSTERYKQSQVEALKAAIEQYHPMK
jgi:integrase/recombinase XerD